MIKRNYKYKGKINNKPFTKDEIIGYVTIDGRKVTYLKPHVKRLKRYPETMHEDYIEHIDQNLIFLDRFSRYLKEVVGVDDFEDNVSSYN